MNVLIACEYSARVRDAFRARGHNAFSCDFEPCEGDPEWHFQQDVREVIDMGWDLMVAHPDCTYLCRAGQRWLHAPDDDRPGKLKGQPRREAMNHAVEFFLWLQRISIPLIAIENPRPSSEVVPFIGKPDQVIQPWQFGEGETKATGLWLKGLPPLVPTNIGEGREARVHRMTPGPNRWKDRSRTMQGIATAMAEQWG